MSIASLMQKAAQALVRVLPHEEVTYGLFRSAGTYSPATSTAVRNEDTATVKDVIFADYRDNEIDGDNIRPRDRKVLIAGLNFAQAFPDHAVKGSGAANDLSFEADPYNAIRGPAGSFAAYLVGHKVIVMGAAQAGNNKQFTVTGVNDSVLVVDGPLTAEDNSPATVKLVRVPNREDRITRSNSEVWEVVSVHKDEADAHFILQVRR
jgi:hypothetical protein